MNKPFQNFKTPKLPKFQALGLIIFLVFSCSSSRKHLDGLFFNQDDLEISGLALKDGNLYFVGDKKENHYIYQANFSSHKLSYSEHLDLKDLQGFDTYLKTYKDLDLEGIAVCHNDFYLVNEKLKHVLKVSGEKFQVLKINFHAFLKDKLNLEPDELSNKGFEGVAIDCIKKRVFVALEREPRAIFEINLLDRKLIRMIQFGTTTPNGVPEDFSDLLYENERLYILERNIQTITKYDLKLKKVTQRLNFNELSQIPMSKLYNTGKPFGLAEGLAMSKTLIYIGIDNNHYPLSQKASGFYNIYGNPSSILKFKRPEGF